MNQLVRNTNLQSTVSKTDKYESQNAEDILFINVNKKKSIQFTC